MPAAATDSELVEKIFHLAARKYLATSSALSRIHYPDITDAAGAWRVTNATAWTAGFYPGVMWILSRSPGDQIWRQRARAWERALRPEAADSSTSNLGFMLLPSLGSDLASTGSRTARRTLLTAAATLAARFNPQVGCLRSKDTPGLQAFVVQIDTMMNLELLFWGARQPDGDPAWKTIAIRHALRTYQEHFRPDGSTYHLVIYDPNSGAVLKKETAQGYGDGSTWTRGQAWAIYGFANAYRETGDPRFLDAARTASDLYLRRLGSSDFVPNWDFDAPSSCAAKEAPCLPDKDSSAGAVASAGLLLLAHAEQDQARGAIYLHAARATLAQLASPDYLLTDVTMPALLAHGTLFRPVNAFNARSSYDTSTIWGDFYFLQALEMLKLAL